MISMHRFVRFVRHRTDLVGAIAVTVIALAAITFVTLAVVQDRAAAARADGAASDYTPAALPTVSPSSSAANSGPIVTIIGDDFTAGPTLTSGAQWTTLLQRDLGVQVVPLAADSAGYIRSPALGAERTFGAQADGVPRDSRIVLFIGGSNDAGTSALTLRRAVGEAISTAKERAPEARVVVVGPLSADGSRPASVTAVRDAVRTAANVAGVTWVDPLNEGWFSDSDRYVSSDGLTLTSLGERTLAGYVGKALEPVVKAVKADD